jgi:hypothetical protein
MLTKFQSILQASGTPKTALENADFSVLHNIAKDAIYLEENLEALIHTIEEMTECHEKHLMVCGCDVVTNTQRNLKYRHTVVTSSRLQVGSVQKRAHNLIELVSNPSKR